MISARPIAAVKQRAKSRVYNAIEQLLDVRVLIPLSAGKRNCHWDAADLVDLIAQLEGGQPSRVSTEVEHGRR